MCLCIPSALTIGDAHNVRTYGTPLAPFEYAYTAAGQNVLVLSIAKSPKTWNRNTECESENKKKRYPHKDNLHAIHLQLAKLESLGRLQTEKLPTHALESDIQEAE